MPRSLLLVDPGTFRPAFGVVLYGEWGGTLFDCCAMLHEGSWIWRLMLNEFKMPGR